MRRLLITLTVASLLGAFLTVPLTSSGMSPTANGKIAFVRSGKGIFVIDKDGSGLTRVARGSASSPVWSPDGGRIAFVRWRTDGTSDIVVMNADGTGKHAVGAPSLGMQEGCALQLPAWSYDGVSILYRDDCFDADPRVAQLRIAAADGSGSLDLTDYGSLNAHSGQPWSPDLGGGSQIVFTSNRDGDPDVYMMNPDGSGEVALSADLTDQDDAVWAPDGTEIAFTTQVIGQDDVPSTSLWLVEPTGGEPSLLVEGVPHATEPLWSPNAAMVLFSRRDYYGSPTAAIVDRTGENEIEVGEGFDSVNASWAPASNAIVFSKNGNLFRYRPSTGATKKLTTGPAYDVAPDWQPLP